MFKQIWDRTPRPEYGRFNKEHTNEACPDEPSPKQIDQAPSFNLVCLNLYAYNI